MGEERYVAYVSTYTQKDNYGIKIYDVDLDNGRFIPKTQVQISNSSYICTSHNGKWLYSITDFGVESYAIQPDGSLKMINASSVNGMRGCYISTDYTDRYLFVAGYHDGKLTILKLREDGAVSDICDEIYHKGLGSSIERNFRPHINCARMTHDNRYLLVADQGMDHVNAYEFDPQTGRVSLADIIRSDLESAPRHIKISKNGKFIYIVHEWKCTIDVYSYEERDGNPYFEKIQTIETVKTPKGSNNAASALSFSMDYNYLLSTNSGDNSVVIYKADQETGLLTQKLCLPISGEYPKDADFFPNNRFLVSLNHESNTMTFFKLDIEKGTMIMNGSPIPIEVPNCIIFYKIG